MRRPATTILFSALWVSLLAPALLAAAPVAARGELAYVEANTELDSGRPRSYAYNLVDGKPATTWCSSSDAREHTIVFGFTKATKVTHFGVIAGALKGDGLNPKKPTVRRIAISDGETRRELTLKNSAELQVVGLDPPATASRLIIDILDTKAGTDPTSPLCIAEISVMSGKRALTGDAVAKHVRSLNTPSRRLLHSWVDELAAPEATLRFSLNGTFTYVFDPLMEGKPARVKGTWRAGHKSVTLEVRGKRYVLKTRRSRIDDGDGNQTVELSLSGKKAPHESMLRSFRAAPARYE